MARRKLPLITTRKELSRNIFENKGFVPLKILTRKKYDPLRLKHQNVDLCDDIVLPILNDRTQNEMNNIIMVNKGKQYSCTNALMKKRNEFLKHAARLDLKWEALETKENGLRSSMISFNRFLKQNLVKRERFVENINHYRKTNKKYDEDINEMKEKNSVLMKIREQMREQLKKHYIYDNFLTKVMYKNSEFKSIFAMINRFESLFSTIEHTVKSYNKVKSELEVIVFEVGRKTFAKVHVIQHLLYQVGLLSHKFSEAKRRSEENEKMFRHVLHETSNLQINLMITRDFIDALYLMMCKRQGLKNIFKKGDFTKQLEVICTGLKIISKITNTENETEISNKQIGDFIIEHTHHPIFPNHGFTLKLTEIFPAADSGFW